MCKSWRAAAALLSHQPLCIADAMIHERLRRAVTFEKLLTSIANTFPACQRVSLALSKIAMPPAQWLDTPSAVHISPESLSNFLWKARCLRFLDISLPGVRVSVYE